MGWNPIKDATNWLERRRKEASGFLKDPLGAVRDPKKLAEGWGAYRIGGFPGNVANNNRQQIADKFSKYAKDPAKMYAGGSAGGVPGIVGINAPDTGNWSDQLVGKQPEPPSAGVDKRLEDIQREMKEDARKYRENLEYTRGQRMGGLLPEYQEAAREGTRRTRENYGRRGLLYSGLRKKGEGELKGKLASELARAQAGIREETERTAQMKEMAAAAQGLENASILMNQAEQYYNMSMQNDLARRRAFGLLGQGLGRAAGTYYGQQSAPAMKDTGAYASDWQMTGEI